MATNAPSITMTTMPRSTNATEGDYYTQPQSNTQQVPPPSYSYYEQQQAPQAYPQQAMPYPSQGYPPQQAYPAVAYPQQDYPQQVPLMPYPQQQQGGPMGYQQSYENWPTPSAPYPDSSHQIVQPEPPRYNDLYT